MILNIDFSQRKLLGIYRIRCTINNNIYIGSALLLYKRYRDHKSSLKRKKHHSIHLQNAFNKYEEENFVFEILEIVENKDNLDINSFRKLIENREQFYLDNLSPSYNISKIAGLNIGHKVTEDHKNKIRAANIGNKYALGYKFTEDQLKNCRFSQRKAKENFQEKVKNNEKLFRFKRKLQKEQILNIFTMKKEGKTMKDISEIMNLHPSQISRILNGRGGYREFVTSNKQINYNIRYKLNKDKIIEIFNKLRSGVSSKQLELEYCIDQSTVSNIKNKKRNYSWLQTVG